MYQLTLPEGAEDAIEQLLARQCCPRHVGTTLDGQMECEVCRVERLPVPLRKVAERVPEFGR